MNNHDLEVISKLVSPNILVHPSAMPCETSYFGVKGVRTWLTNQWESFPDLNITDYFTVAQKDIIAMHWSAQGTSKDTFLMLNPTGKEVKYTGSSMYRIENSKIAEIWETRNTLAILQQLNPEIGQGQHSH